MFHHCFIFQNELLKDCQNFEFQSPALTLDMSITGESLWAFEYVNVQFQTGQSCEVWVPGRFLAMRSVSHFLVVF